MTSKGPFRAAPWVAVTALAWLALFPITSVDAYYHVATGKRILDERAIPVRGVGSATFGEAPWHDNEWGFQLVAALVGRTTRDRAGVVVFTALGTAALILLRALCLAGTLGLLSGVLARRGVDPLTGAVGLVLTAFLTFNNLFWTVRPQVFSYLLLAATIYLVERDRSGERWAVWGVLPLLALWSNLHGAFVIGIAVIGAEAAGEWMESLVSRRGEAESRRRAWRWTGLLLLAPLAGSLNPFGYRQVLHPFLYVLHPEIHGGNAEWARPDLLHLPLFLLCLALLVLALAVSRRAPWADLLRVVLFVGLFLSAIRHLPLAAIVLVPILIGALHGAASAGGWRLHLEPTGRAWGSPWVRLGAAVMLVAGVVALSGARFVGPVPRFGEASVRPLPEREVRFLAREKVEGNGFNAYRFGGFLMLRLYPEEKVFMDGRNDLYLSFRDRVYNRILFTRPGWRPVWNEMRRKYDVGWVLLYASDPLAQALRGDPEWLPCSLSGGGDSGIAFFLRNDARNRERAARCVTTPGGIP